MINKILKDIDNEECYYVGTNGCLYQDLGKEELLAIKQEIERLNNIINRTTKYVQSLSSKGRDCDIYEDIKQDILKELKGSGK